MAIPLAVPLIAAGISAAGQFGAMSAARKQREAGDKLVSDILGDVEGGKYDTEFTLSPELRAATEQQKQAFERIRLDAGRRAQQALGGFTAGLRGGDARTVGVLPQFLAGTMGAQTQADLAATQGIAQADLGLATKAQDLLTQSQGANQALRNQIMLNRLGAGQAAASAGFTGQQAALQNLSAMPLNLTSLLISADANNQQEDTFNPEALPT